MSAEAIKEGDAYRPESPPPTVEQNEEYCEGKIMMPCCCPRLYTNTQILSIGPQSEPDLINLIQNTVSNYESTGYIVLAHSVVDTGAGWMLGLTVGWYA